MNNVIRRSGLNNYLITAALLTLFVSGFGVFANIQIEQRNVSCAGSTSEIQQTADCEMNEYYAAIMPSEQTDDCQCSLANALASHQH